MLFKIAEFNRYFTFCLISVILALTINFYQIAPKLEANSLGIDAKARKIALEISVRIFSDFATGSGVIIARQGKVYQVLTNYHVVGDESDIIPERQYQVMAADETMHPAKWLDKVKFSGLDLAIVEFSSDRAYTVAQLGKEPQPGDRVYAAGFPNWQLINPQRIENTRRWGNRAFKFTAGEVKMLLSLPLMDGYQLGYTNDIEQGMSGGAILNQDGELVGINGRLKYPLPGINAFKFADGTLPSQAKFRQMEALSWGIPLTSAKQYLP